MKKKFKLVKEVKHEGAYSFRDFFFFSSGVFFGYFLVWWGVIVAILLLLLKSLTKKTDVYFIEEKVK